MNTYPLKAVTVLQPYASAIAAGVKPWENRPRPIRLDDGPIWLALHAGLKLYPSAEIYQRWATSWITCASRPTRRRWPR